MNATRLPTRPVPNGGRECDCPEWVIACAHLGNRRLTVVDRDLLPPEVAHQWLRATDKRYWVTPREFSDTAKALDFFRDAESKLLRGAK